MSLSTQDICSAGIMVFLWHFNINQLHTLIKIIFQLFELNLIEYIYIAFLFLNFYINSFIIKLNKMSAKVVDWTKALL